MNSTASSSVTYVPIGNKCDSLLHRFDITRRAASSREAANKPMSYTYSLPKSTSFTGTGLHGYAFGPLSQRDLDVYYIESEKGHDTFMVSKKITRTYYVLSGYGYFTINSRRYDVCPGVLVEVPPKVEYSYSGKMTLIAFARPRWFSGNDRHTRWNPDVPPHGSPSLPGHQSRLVRLLALFGKSRTKSSSKAAI
jgi:mannose-6-phosphate isomerase-like protein (cupin superfamily)